MPPELTTIVVSWNTRDLLARCLDALEDATLGLVHETIVVDNGSTDGTREMLAARPRAVTVIANTENLGFAAANNQGLAAAHAPFALLLNSDAFINSTTIGHALAIFDAHPRAGIVGVQVLNPDGSLQAREGTFPTLLDDLARSIGLDQLARHQPDCVTEPALVDWVHGACIFVRLESVADVGGLDERFFMYSEEVDWCLRVRRHGWEVWYDPDATVVHLGGGSSTSDDLPRRTALYRSRLGLRRRASGPGGSAVLWGGMAIGLAARIVLRATVQAVTRQQLGRQSPASDWRLLGRVVRMDPLARWAVA